MTAAPSTEIQGCYQEDHATAVSLGPGGLQRLGPHAGSHVLTLCRQLKPRVVAGPRSPLNCSPRCRGSHCSVHRSRPTPPLAAASASSPARALLADKGIYLAQGYRFGKCIFSPIFISREAQDTLSLLDKPLFCTVWVLTPTVKIDSIGTLTLWSLCRTSTHSIKWTWRVDCAFGYNVLLLLLLIR